MILFFIVPPKVKIHCNYHRILPVRIASICQKMAISLRYAHLIYMEMVMVRTDFEKTQKRSVLMVTGLSGSGKSSVMRALEDLGFFCIDNLPIPLLSTFLSFAFKSQANLLKVAIGIDVRAGLRIEAFAQELKKLRDFRVNGLCDIKVLFVRASDQTLMKRFQETRRKHPLGGHDSLLNAIRKENALLAPIIDLADIVLDTDALSIHDLRHRVHELFDQEQGRELVVNLVSFGFKYGVPGESNLVYDVRFLPNPYFVSELRELDGRTAAVQDFLFAQPAVRDYWERLCGFLRYSIEKYYEEGRFFTNIAIGCTGGKHRSVTFVERITQERWPNVRFLVHHRDLDKS